MINRSRKIFCVGFHKTGTTSLYGALTSLGLKVSGTIGDNWSAERLARDGAKLCIDTMKSFDAAEDMPWPVFFRELDDAFPGAKFILTLRDNDLWFESIDRHFGGDDIEMHRFVYGENHGQARNSKSRWIEVKSRHENEVRAYFRDRPGDLLEIDVTAGEGWEKLSPFLGVVAPGREFPALNRSVDRANPIRKLRRRLLMIAGKKPYPERLA